MTGLTEATTTWVDSLGGGIGVLKNLGALGTTVFSKQIAGGINNAISAMTRSSSNKKILENAFNQAVNLQNITDNKYTKDIIEQQKNILKVSGVLKPEELKELQDAIDSLSPTADELNRVSQLRQEYEKIEQKVAKLDFDGASLEDTQNLEKVRQKLEEINREIDELLAEGNEDFSFITAIGGTKNSQNWGKRANDAKNTLSRMDERVRYYRERGLVSKESGSQWADISAQFRNFAESDILGPNQKFTAEAAKEYNRLAQLASDAFTNILEKAQETNNEIILDLQKDTRAAREDVASQEKDYADKLARDLKKQSDALDPKRRQQTIQGLVEVAGGIQTIGVAIDNVQQIGSIWKNNDLEESEKWAQTLTNIGQTAFNAVPGIVSLVNAFKLLHVSNPILLGVTAALSALVFIAPQVMDFSSNLEKAQNKLAESTEEYKTSVDELKTLEDQLKNTNDQLKELYSIAEKDLTITNKEDIKRLEAERIQLQAQLDLKKQIAEQNARQVLTDALAEREEKKKSKEKPQKSSSYEKAVDLASREYSGAFDLKTGAFTASDQFLFSDEYINIFEAFFSQKIDENGNILSDYGQGILDFVQKGEEIVATGSQEQIKAFQDEIANYISNLSKDRPKYNVEKYANDILHSYGLEGSVSYKDDFWGKRFEVNKGEIVDSTSLQNAQAELNNYLSLENQNAVQFSQELLTFLLNFQTEYSKNLEERRKQAEATMAKADAVLPTLREKEFLTTGEAEYLKEIEETAAWYYNNNIDTIASSIFRDITEDQYKNIQSNFSEINLEDEESIKNFLSWLDEYLGELDPQKLLDEYYHGLSVMDVLKIMVGEPDASWESFKGEDGANSDVQVVKTIASQITEEYDKAKNEISLIKAAQQQLSSKGTLSGWEQEDTFNSLLTESGKLEEWNNLLGYTSDEKIAWLEKYLDISTSIKTLEGERENNLTELAQAEARIYSDMRYQIRQVDILKELKDGTDIGSKEYYEYEDQISKAEAELGRIQQEYDAIVEKIEQLQNVDEDTAKLILSQYNTVQKLNKAYDDGIIKKETHLTLYDLVLQRQLESLGITQETFNAYKDLTGATDEMALNILTASQNMSALKSALPSKEEFDFSTLGPNEKDYTTIATLYSSQIAGLGNLFSGIFGQDLTEQAQKLLYQPDFLSLVQEGFIEGNEESLRQVFQRMASLLDRNAEDFEGLITRYIAGFQEFTDAQIAAAKRVGGFGSDELAKQYLEQYSAVKKAIDSLSSIFSKDDTFGTGEENVANYYTEIKNLEEALEAIAGIEFDDDAALDFFTDSKNLNNFKDGINGSEESLDAFAQALSETFTDVPVDVLKEKLREASTAVSEFSQEQINVLMSAGGGRTESEAKAIITAQSNFGNLQSVLPDSSTVDFSQFEKGDIDFITNYTDEVEQLRVVIGAIFGTEITGSAAEALFDPQLLGELQTGLEGDAGALEKILTYIAKLAGIDLETLGLDLGALSRGLVADKIDTYGEAERAYGGENKSDEYYDAYSDISTKAVSDYGWDEDEFDAYVRSLEDSVENLEDFGDTSKEQKLQLELLAKTAIRTGDALDDLSKVLKDNADILKNADKNSTDYIQALAEVRKGIEQLLGLENDVQKEFLSDSFVTDNLDLIQEAALDGGEALDELRVKASDEIIVNIGAQMDETRATSEVSTMLANMTAAIENTDLANIQLGASIDTTPLATAFNEMLASGQFTADELNAILASIGFSPTVETISIPYSDQIEDEYEANGGVITIGKKKYPITADVMAMARSTGVVTFPVINGKKPRFVGGSAPRVGSGNSGGRGGGGGSKTPSKPKTEKPKDQDTDPFHDINIQIKKLEESFEELEDKQEGLLGDDLIDNLNKELDILDKQNEAYREKLRIAELLKRVQQEELSQQGVEFDANGQISNYEQILNTRLNALNDMINKYNHMSAEEQESYESTLEKAQEDYDKLVEDIEKYEELINDTVPEVQQELRDNLNKKIEIEMEKFKLAVDVRLDMGEAQREWNEFKNKVIKELDDEDILGGAKANLEDILSYYNTNGVGGGAIQSVTEQIRNTMIELNKINSSGWSGIYGENHQQALEDLKNYTDELKSQLEDVKDLTDEINESVLDTIDKIKDDFDKQIDAYSQVSDLIQHDMRVIELLYGEDEYGALGEFYDKQAESNKSQIEFLRMQTEFWRQQMAQTDPGTKAWDSIKENYEDSLNSLNDALEDALQNMIDKYTNAINDIFNKLEDKVTDGLGLDYVGEEWDLINRNADQYLDLINAAYAIQDSQQKYLDAINESADPAVQRRLNDLMNDQLKILREKEKITQYDVDRANMMLDIELKRIALEEQQQNKTKLRLRRDTQGNYTYQYVTDEDNITAAREELAAAQNDLYNFDKSQYQNTLNEMYDTYKEFQEKMLAIYEDTTMTDEERERKKALIVEQYGQLINNMTAENAQIRKNLEESAFIDLADIYDTNIEQYQNMTQQEKDILLNDLVPAWNGGIQHMVDTFVSEGGFVPTCIEAFEKLEEAMQQYKDDISSTTGTAGMNPNDLLEGIDITVNAAEQLVGINDQLIEAANQEMTAIRDIISELDQLIAKYTEAKNAAIDAVNSGFSAYQGDQNQNALDYEKDNSSGSTGAAIDPSLPTLGQRMKYTSGRIYASPNGEEPSSSMAGGQEVVITQIQPGALKPYRVALNGQNLGWLDKTQLARFKSGGYTGEWGDYGKLAILDEKELVLEKDDTANILAAVNIVRDITNDLDDMMMKRMANISAGIGIPSRDFPSIAETIEQQVHIDASFPNVTSSDEIQNAFNNLVNVAAQRAMNSNR